MATEALKFKLELYAIMWDKPPTAEILINQKSHHKGEITGTEDKPTIIEFTAELKEAEDYELIIKRSGKRNSQTVVNAKGDILKDQLLGIKNIEIDEIDIGSLVYPGVYPPNYPEPWASQQQQAGIELEKSFNNVTKMGHDGTWTLKFSSPFYMWLLENLY